MTSSPPPETSATPQATVVIERTYSAPVEDLWALWTTKDGFESWWGPVGFRVEVQTLEAREGGVLAYAMIADSPQMIAAMKSMGQPTSTSIKGSYGEFVPNQRLRLVQVIDFVAGTEPYDSVIDVQFLKAGDKARMVIALQPHLDPHWTKMSIDGFTSQLTKLEARFAQD
ncbi:SRPBCC domain-containing protein [Asticcacaulis sp. 201]|uniref:SRPBCC family protein n=1 Tax=Asticcacaulis sp. 201 TaxID=3028787 RepID=UPI002915F2BA|nr:SRPBCC domain-containing protein [Asticcacaulis sp. 201]MDV6332681.1 SRPBCC domain-containing protein [Asticcacaulis sp. 201]